MSLLTRGRLGEYLDLLRNIIEECQEVGAVREDISAGMITNFVFGAVDELVNSWLLAEKPGDLMRYYAPLIELVSGGLALKDHHGGEVE
jgi:TetR/AcrR family fatty acid metabolism transcriptional regulator